MSKYLPMTVVVMSYNQADVIGEAIGGLANQSHPIHQLIVSDDASTDNTFQRIGYYIDYFELSKKIKKLSIIRQDKNQGLIGHLKKIVPHVICDLIVVNAGDDISLPNRLEVIANDYLKLGSPRYYLSHHPVQVIGQNSIFTPPVIQQGLTLESMSTAFALHIGASEAFTKNLIIDFPEIKFNTYEDLILGFRAAMLDAYSYIEQPLMLYRPGGISSNSKKHTEDAIRMHASETLLQRTVDALHLNRLDIIRLINEKYQLLELGLNKLNSQEEKDLPVVRSGAIDQKLYLQKFEKKLAPLIDVLGADAPPPKIRLIYSVDDFVVDKKGKDSWSLFMMNGSSVSDFNLEYIRWYLKKLKVKNPVALFLDAEELVLNDEQRKPIYGPLCGYESLCSNPYSFGFLLVCDDWVDLSDFSLNHISVELLSYHLSLRAFHECPDKIVRLPFPLINFEPSSYIQKLKEDNLWSNYAKVLKEHLSVSSAGADVLEGPAPGTFHVIYPLIRTPSVSIVVHTRDQLPFLSRCIESLLAKTNYPEYEIIVVDNDSQSVEVQVFLNGLEQVAPERIRVLRVPGAYNFSRMNNLAVAQARGEYILLLNNETAVLHADWLSHMMRHALRNGVGIVGARLISPEGTIQHAGVIMGLRGPADHPCLGMKPDEPGYMFRAQLTQNFSAVTAACMLVSKAVYEEVGGLDEDDFAVSYNDVDFCLKVGQTGRRIVWTPLATLLHEGSASQKASIENLSQANKSARFSKEQAAMYRKWPEVIANDPAYNPNLSLVERGYEVETNPLLCYDPLREFYEHKVVAFAADPYGCGNYRILQPMQAMLDDDLCIGGASPEIFGPNLALRSRADVLVFQRPTSDVGIQTLESLIPLKGVKKIFEVDDNLTRVPYQSVHYKQMPTDIRKRMIKSIGLCDRLIVSTQPLAEEFKHTNDDVRVVLNRLPPAMWGESPPVTALRDSSLKRKPVVAWAGGVGHGGDLALVAQVVKELADVVDWEFFGMCPDAIRPYVKRVHAGVPTLEYPAKLMQLTQNWDLAIAPLEVNAFNESKSNLRLLEYGWCGLPVVCSDVTPYQDPGFPVTRVKNRYKDWKAAILERVNDLENTRQQGLALQAVVQRDWMLKGEHVVNWYKAWTD